MADLNQSDQQNVVSTFAQVLGPLEELQSTLQSPRSMMIGLYCLPVFAAIHYIAYWLRFDTIDDKRWMQLIATMSAILVIKSFLFVHYRIYQGWSRYATFYDLVTLAQATTASAVCLACLLYTSPSPRDLSTSRMPSSA